MSDPSEALRQLSSYAYRLLSYRPYSRKEIVDKLTVFSFRHHFSSDLADRVAHQLETDGFIQDAEFARLWVESGRRRGLSSRVLRMQLARKGIDRNLIDSVLGEGHVSRKDDEKTAFTYALRQSGKMISGTVEDRKQRLIARLLRRGFSWDTARRAVDEAGENSYNRDVRK